MKRIGKEKARPVTRSSSPGLDDSLLVNLTSSRVTRLHSHLIDARLMIPPRSPSKSGVKEAKEKESLEQQEAKQEPEVDLLEDLSPDLNLPLSASARRVLAENNRRADAKKQKKKQKRQQKKEQKQQQQGIANPIVGTYSDNESFPELLTDDEAAARLAKQPPAPAPPTPAVILPPPTTAPPTQANIPSLPKVKVKVEDASSRKTKAKRSKQVLDSSNFIDLTDEPDADAPVAPTSAVAAPAVDEWQEYKVDEPRKLTKKPRHIRARILADMTLIERRAHIYGIINSVDSEHSRSLMCPSSLSMYDMLQHQVIYGLMTEDEAFHPRAKQAARVEREKLEQYPPLKLINEFMRETGQRMTLEDWYRHNRDSTELKQASSTPFRVNRALFMVSDEDSDDIDYTEHEHEEEAEEATSTAPSNKMMDQTD